MKKTAVLITAILCAALVLGFAAVKILDYRIVIQHPAFSVDTEPALKAQDALPDLSALGIDITNFVQSEEPYERPLFHGTMMSDGLIPSVKWTRYTNSSGSMLVFDEQGRLRLFSNETNIRNGKIIGTESYYDFQLRKKAHELLAPLTADFVHFSDDWRNSQKTADGTGYIVSMCRKPAEGAVDALSITMSIDGKVRTIQIDYCDLKDTGKTSELDAKFDSYLADVPSEYGSQFLSVEDAEKSYMSYLGVTYGIYSYSVKLSSDAGNVYDSRQVAWSVE